MRSTTHIWLPMMLCVALAASCGGKDGTDEDTDEDVQDEDVGAEALEDPAPEPTDDPAPEPVDDLMPDPVDDPMPDPADDPDEEDGAAADAEDDVADDDAASDAEDDDAASTDVMGEDSEDDASDAVDEDDASDAVDEDAGPTGPSGTSCTDPAITPINVPADLPFEDLAATTCGAGDTYRITCLGSYDGGEDVIYRLDVASSTEVNVWIDPKSSGWTGLALDSACPIDATTCMSTSTLSAATPHDIGCQTLAAGTYHVMVDVWPSPSCIPDFDLHVHECVCTPGSTSCLDSTTLRVCNGLHTWDPVTCINSCGDTGGGVDGCLATSTETEPNGDATEALTNNLITVPWDGWGEITTGTDEDYYAFTLTSPTIVTIQTDAHGSSAVGDTKLWLYEDTFTTQTPPACSGTSGCVEFDEDGGPGLYSLIENRGLPAGTYYVRVAGYSSTYTGTYRLTIWFM
ncbi:MAG: DVUA0089 family protein [Deltaproteobacteria bacterium]|nr:DVUA0089 family protein [Deltaproteobacteria bacterium]